MSYHENPAINAALLTIINDGDGAICGRTYQQRKAAAEFGLFDYRYMAREYSRQNRVQFGGRNLTREEILATASALQEYYRAHVAECTHD